MASVIDICNTSLAHLGSDNVISSIDPPDGSTEAGYCKRFYPLARKEMIEGFVWPFAQKRALLAEVTNNSMVWSYAYALPSDCLRPVRVLTFAQLHSLLLELDVTNQPMAMLFDESKSALYEIEDGVLYTHEAEATLLYLRDVVDTTKFTPTFTSALSYLVASYLAGPIIRGAEGVNAAQKYRQIALQVGASAATFAARSSHEWGSFTASHLAAR